MSGTVCRMLPECFFAFYLREAFQSQTNTEKILYNKSHNSSCTRYHIELINRSCGGWLL